MPGTGPRGQDGEVHQIEIRPGGQTVVTLDQAKATVKVTVAMDGETNAQVVFVDVKTNASTSLEMGNPRGGFRRGGDEEPDGPPEEIRPKTHTVTLAPGTYEVAVIGMGNGVYLTGISATGAKAIGRTVTILGAGNIDAAYGQQAGASGGCGAASGQTRPRARWCCWFRRRWARKGIFTRLGAMRPIRMEHSKLQGWCRGSTILVAIDHGWDVDWRNPATLAQYLVHGMPVDLTKVAKVQEEVEAVEP